MTTYKAAWMGDDSFGRGDGYSIAVDDDGHMVASWVSSSEGWAHSDLRRSWPADADVTLDWVKPDDLPEPCPGCGACDGSVDVDIEDWAS